MLNNETLRELLNNAPNDVLSLYLNVDPSQKVNQNEPRGWNIYVKNALRDIENTLQDSDVDVKSILKQTENFLESYTPTGKSLVLFVGEDGYLENYDLPVIVDNHYSFGNIDVVPMLWALDEYERYIVVLVDAEQARFLSAYLGRANTNEEMTIDFDDYDFREHGYIYSNSDADGLHGSGGEQFEAMRDEHTRRFHKDVAEQIRQAIEDTSAERVILGGSEKSAHAVQDLLHTSIQDKVVDILSIPMDANDAKVAESIEVTALAYEREQEMLLVNEVIDLAKAGGRASLDNDVLEDALNRQQVELLILPYPMEDTAFAADATLKALQSGAKVELVHGSAAAKLTHEAPFAARFYYILPETQNA